MATHMVRLLFILQIVFLAKSCVEGIMCFQCNSMIHADCADLTSNMTSSFHYRECEEEQVSAGPIFCRKIVQKIVDRDNLIRVVRKCAWVKHPRLSCYKVHNYGHHEEVCQCFTDGCNSATGRQVSLLAASLPLALAAITSMKFYH